MPRMSLDGAAISGNTAGARDNAKSSKQRRRSMGGGLSAPGPSSFDLVSQLAAKPLKLKGAEPSDKAVVTPKRGKSFMSLSSKKSPKFRVSSAKPLGEVHTNARSGTAVSTPRGGKAAGSKSRSTPSAVQKAPRLATTPIRKDSMGVASPAAISVFSDIPGATKRQSVAGDFEASDQPLSECDKSRVSSAKDLIKQAKAAQELGKKQEALRLFEKASELLPQHQKLRKRVEQLRKAGTTGAVTPKSKKQLVRNVPDIFAHSAGSSTTQTTLLGWEYDAKHCTGWSQGEHHRLVKAMRLSSTDLSQIGAIVGTKTEAACRQYIAARRPFNTVAAEKRRNRSHKPRRSVGTRFVVPHLRKSPVDRDLDVATAKDVETARHHDDLSKKSMATSGGHVIAQPSDPTDMPKGNDAATVEAPSSPASISLAANTMHSVREHIAATAEKATKVTVTDHDLQISKAKPAEEPAGDDVESQSTAKYTSGGSESALSNTTSRMEADEDNVAVIVEQHPTSTVSLSAGSTPHRGSTDSAATRMEADEDNVAVIVEQHPTSTVSLSASSTPHRGSTDSAATPVSVSRKAKRRRSMRLQKAPAELSNYDQTRGAALPPTGDAEEAPDVVSSQAPGIRRSVSDQPATAKTRRRRRSLRLQHAPPEFAVQEGTPNPPTRLKTKADAAPETVVAVQSETEVAEASTTAAADTETNCESAGIKVATRDAPAPGIRRVASHEPTTSTSRRRRRSLRLQHAPPEFALQESGSSCEIAQDGCADEVTLNAEVPDREAPKSSTKPKNSSRRRRSLRLQSAPTEFAASQETAPSAVAAANSGVSISAAHTGTTPDLESQEAPVIGSRRRRKSLRLQSAPAAFAVSGSELPNHVPELHESESPVTPDSAESASPALVEPSALKKQHFDAQGDSEVDAVAVVVASSRIANSVPIAGCPSGTVDSGDSRDSAAKLNSDTGGVADLGQEVVEAVNSPINDTPLSPATDLESSEPVPTSTVDDSLLQSPAVEIECVSIDVREPETAATVRSTDEMGAETVHSALESPGAQSAGGAIELGAQSPDTPKRALIQTAGFLSPLSAALQRADAMLQKPRVAPAPISEPVAQEASRSMDHASEDLLPRAADTEVHQTLENAPEDDAPVVKSQQKRDEEPFNPSYSHVRKAPPSRRKSLSRRSRMSMESVHSRRSVGSVASTSSAASRPDGVASWFPHGLTARTSASLAKTRTATGAVFGWTLEGLAAKCSQLHRAMKRPDVTRVLGELEILCELLARATLLEAKLAASAPRSRSAILRKKLMRKESDDLLLMKKSVRFCNFDLSSVESSSMAAVSQNFEPDRAIALLEKVCDAALRLKSQMQEGKSQSLVVHGVLQRLAQLSHMSEQEYQRDTLLTGDHIFRAEIRSAAVHHLANLQRIVADESGAPLPYTDRLGELLSAALRHQLRLAFNPALTFYDDYDESDSEGENRGGVGCGAEAIDLGWLKIVDGTGSLQYNGDDLGALIHRALHQLYMRLPAFQDIVNSTDLDVMSELKEEKHHVGPSADMVKRAVDKVEKGSLETLDEVVEYTSAHMFLHRVLHVPQVVDRIGAFGAVWQRMRKLSQLITRYQCADEMFLAPLSDVGAFSFRLDQEREAIESISGAALARVDRLKSLADVSTCGMPAVLKDVSVRRDDAGELVVQFGPGSPLEAIFQYPAIKWTTESEEEAEEALRQAEEDAAAADVACSECSSYSDSNCIECDTCNRAFHLSCLGLPEDYAENCPSFTCTQCYLMER